MIIRLFAFNKDIEWGDVDEGVSFDIDKKDALIPHHFRKLRINIIGHKQAITGAVHFLLQ